MGEEMKFYWELVQHDGTTLDVPPDLVATIKSRMEQKLVINTTSMAIPANQIKYFRKTSKVYTDQPLIESASQAFREPLLNEDGSIQAKWVKKPYTQREWAKLGSPGYRRLPDEDGMVIGAFKQPIHQIDVAECTTLTEDEISKVEHNT